MLHDYLAALLDHGVERCDAALCAAAAEDARGSIVLPLPKTGGEVPAFWFAAPPAAADEEEEEDDEELLLPPAMPAAAP